MAISPISVGASGQSAGGNSFLSSASNAIMMPVNAFMEGLSSNIFGNMTTKTNAKNYNKYQDITYPQDTRRMQQRMDALYPGTNPWERLGVNAASPLPSPEMEANERAGQSLLPLKLAQMNNQTQLAIAKMQTDTQKEVVGVQTDNGNLPKTQVAEALARIPKTKAETALTVTNDLLAQEGIKTAPVQRAFLRSQTRTQDALTEKTKTEEWAKRVETQLAQNKDFREAVLAVLQALPVEELSIAGPKQTSRLGWQGAWRSLMQGGSVAAGKQGDDQTAMLNRWWSMLSHRERRSFMDNLASGLSDAVGAAGEYIADGLEQAADAATLGPTRRALGID